MSHSFTNLLYHLVYSTKHRQPWLDDEVGPRTFAYLGGLIRELGGIALAVGGMPDHVHLLVKLRQDRALAEVLRELKAKSSLWIHQTFPTHKSFAWQTGYGAFTVSRSQVEVVRTYVLNQQTHHARQTFQQEFRDLLRRHEVEFTEEDLWD